MGCGASSGPGGAKSDVYKAPPADQNGKSSTSSPATPAASDTVEKAPAPKAPAAKWERPVPKAPLQISDGDLAGSNVAEYICESLVRCGVTHVFGGHGGAVVPLIDAICRHPKLTWIYTRIEASASMAAAAVGKLTGAPSCCIGTSGPGASHLITGLMDANLDRVPVICLTGLKKTYTMGYSDFQDINQAEIFKASGLRTSKNCIHAHAIVPLLRDVVSRAMTEEVCAHLAVPFDVQQAPLKVPEAEGFSRGGDLVSYCTPAFGDVQKVAAFFVKCRQEGERMLFAVGHRVFDRGVSDAAATVLDMAVSLGVPIVTSLDAKGAVPEDHPQVVGVVGIFGNPGMEASAELVAGATVVVSFGVDDHSQLVLGQNGLQNTRLVEIDKTGLVDLRFQAEHALTGDIHEVTKLLAQEVVIQVEAARAEGCKVIAKTDGCKVLSSLGVASWGNQGDAEAGFEAQSLHHRSVNYEAPADEISAGYCHPGLVLKLLGDRLTKDAVVSIDVGDCALWSSLCLPLTKENQRCIASMKMGTMGYSIYGALATAATRPKSQNIGIAGDGAFQMASNELATLQQMKATVVFIVFANRKLGRVHNETWGPPDAEKAQGCQIINPDFCLLAEAHGGKGLRLNESDVENVSKVIDEALSTKGITIIEVIQDPDVKPCMHKAK